MGNLHQQRASHRTVHIVFLANDGCLRDYDLVVAHCWPDGLELTPGFYRASQTVLGVYLKRRPTCSRVTSASSALAVLNELGLCALYKSTHSLTHC